MKFTKMQGLGNDYVYVDCFAETVTDPVDLARRVSDRHTGIGSDGLILVQPSSKADVRMEMYNADGSRARMCGNGIRCVAKYAVEHGRATGPELSIDTDSGIKHAWCTMDGGRVTAVRIDMGKPSLLAADLPAMIDQQRMIDYPLQVNEHTLVVTGVSMGNPHAVHFIDEHPTGGHAPPFPFNPFPLAQIGPLIEHAPQFPQRINFHIVRVDARDHLTMRTWERGSGITRACGTGACAVAVAAAATDRAERSAVVTLPGGDLTIEWSADDRVFKTGPAVEVFKGEWLEVVS